MQGKILVIDPIATNRIMLKSVLTSACYDVQQASTVAEAAVATARFAPDLILSALSFPDGGIADLRAFLKRGAVDVPVPIVALTGRHTAADRVAALKSGANDVLVRPVDDTLLLGRVRSVIRAHNTACEWHLREDTSQALGLAEPAAEFAAPSRITLISADPATAHGWTAALKTELPCSVRHCTPRAALAKIYDAPPADAIVLVLPDDLAQADASLHIISVLRAHAVTSMIGLLIVQQTPAPRIATNALDLGADDLMLHGFDAAEMAQRLRALLDRKRQVEAMRRTVRTGLRAAIFDPLTGLYNRRYAMPHLSRTLEQARRSGQSFAVMVADMDHFKRINDHFGHAAGDAVLIETARRLRAHLRPGDMVSRLGGEEFLIVMPAVSPAQAQAIASRICQDMAQTPFTLPGAPHPEQVTISIGLAMGPGAAVSSTHPRPTADGARDLLDSADQALYAAKLKGRNRVNLGSTAA
ncbi:diguanylate cyclase domain-containing protein [Sulfitobacter sp. S190]|uniref:diguanylate cyclase domain-containing protein n=1 Tax=Sulfitobacter sp. S190 TaxID=2867022 RepID=UPI0021A6B4D7|nr:diguanylate cyclase [Sulfitobacter sp. S190]UWR23502.1 diguanylate cyclase [Sulfitobacter sp. S190]